MAILSVALSIMVGGTLATPSNASVLRYITVSATGSITVVPDAVRIIAAVTQIGVSSEEALAKSSLAASELRKALAINNVLAKDIATQFININPEYSYPQDGGKPVLKGYSASQTFVVTIRAANSAGVIIETILDVGNDSLTISGVTPFILNSNTFTESARAAAVKNAKVKASSYARFLGVKLGKVVFLDEFSIPSELTVAYSSTTTSDSATQVDLGQQNVSVSVKIRWSIS
jgi:uncharacterized protein YggE